VEEKPLVLLGGNGSWPGGAVAELLRGRGYRLRSLVDLAEMVRVIHREKPDLILLARGMRGGDPIGLCRTLRGRRWLATTPIFYLCSEGRAEEAAALEAGAWDAVKCPPDPELFLARVENAVQMKRQADEALRRGLIDQLTGCYNRAGLLARLEEEILHARRHKEPLACLVVSLEPFPRVIETIGDPEVTESAFLAAARILRQGSRRTDILARHEDYGFSIVAPATARAGARKLVNRINEAFANSPVRVRAKGQARPFRPIVGITVRASWPGEEETPETLVREASEALALAKKWGSGHRIFSQLNGTHPNGANGS
jgi:diguanylate cyclase (GGDEF)-like protein